ncbi:potassium channel family protein [Streptomyces sp. NBC_00669]|uniref:potassium channel family protein n=1 Tax=Streptomyces sp. NBC_00669 TaxID=2976011 RepID=UPI002E2F473A|nr:ion channel [Streptomyces sp. NBC_00669]
MAADPRLTRWEDRSELPLFVVALCFLTAYAVHVLARGMPAAGHDACLAVVYSAWAVFLADYLVRWRLGPDRRLVRYVRHHVLDTVVLILPLLRPLRFVSTYQAVQQRRAAPRLSLYGRVIAYTGITAVLLGFAASLAVYQAERGAPDATIRTYGDSVWWMCSTITTVGYGDVTPVTPLGRTVAVGLMIGGVALLGAVTGSFSSWLLQVFAREGDEKPPAR